MSSILNAFKSKQPFLLFLLPFILLAFWYKWLMNPVINIDESSLMPFSKYLINSLGDTPVLLGVLSIVTLLITALLIYYINDRYSILKTGTSLPSFLFILLVGCLPSVICFNPAVFASLFILLSLVRILYAYNNHTSIACFFDAGFFVGLASAFYFQSIFFIVFVFIGMISISRFRFREIIAVFMGTALPIVFMWTFFFYTDSLPAFYSVINNAYSLTPICGVPSIYEWTFFAFAISLFVISLANIFLRSPIVEVFELKFFTILFWILVICIMIPIIFKPLGLEVLVLGAIPISFFIGRYFVLQKHKYIGDILLVLLLLSAMILQFPDLLKMISSYL